MSRTSRLVRRRLLSASSLAAALAVAGSTTAHAQNFQGLGFVGADSVSRASGVSADGLVVVGLSGEQIVGSGAQAFRWTAATGMVGLGYLPGFPGNSWALATNADGSVIVGNAGSPDQAFRWTAAGGMVGLGSLPGGGNSLGSGVNADGSVVVGTAVGQAYRWTSASGMVPLGTLPGRFRSTANGVSADGTVVVGDSDCTHPAICTTNPEAYRWTALGGMVGLGSLAPGTGSSANAVSADGKVVVGYGRTTPTVNGIFPEQAFRWTAATGMVSLGPGGGVFTVANAVNADGSVVVGTGDGPFRWTAATGMQLVQNILAANGENLAGWQLLTADSVSADGTVIVGLGVSPNASTHEAWIARIPLNAFAFLDLAGANRTLGSLLWGGIVTNSGPGPATLTVGGDNSDTTFKGSIRDGAGTTALVKEGTGTTILTGSHTYTGGTTISGGILQIGNGGAGGSIIGDVANNAILAINRSDTFTFAGLISGSGALQQNGAGTTILTANNSYTGATTINAGGLIVNGSIASSSGLTVNSGATVGGIGTLPAITINAGGNLSPGNSIGTISIAGNLTFVGAGNYLVEVSPTAADRTNATGAAALSGTLRALGLGGAYTAGTRYTVIDASGGVSGAFGNLAVSGSFGTTRPRISYDANHVYLVLDQGLISPFLIGGTPNQRAVAGAVDMALTNGSQSALFAALVGLSAGQLPGALDQLSGEVHVSTAGVLADESRYMRDAMLGRLRQASYGGNTSTASLSVGGPVAAFADGELDSALAYGKSPIVTKAPRMVAPSYDVTFWAQGFGARGRFETDGNAATLRRDLAGFISGVDTRVGGNGRLGVAAGYTGSKNALDGRGTADVETAHIAGYGGWNVGAVNLRAGGAYAFHSIATDRLIAFPGFFDRTTANYDGHTGQIFGELGYGFAFGNVAIEPFAGAAWVRVKTDAAAERGGLAALNVAGTTFETGYATLGIRAASMIALGHDMMLVPRGTLAWQHAFDTITPAGVLAFQAAPVPFTIAGVPIARNSLLAEAGLDLAIGRNATLGVSYVGQVASNVQDHAAKGKFSWKF